jgi:hypothetical protein
MAADWTTDRQPGSALAPDLSRVASTAISHRPRTKSTDESKNISYIVHDMIMIASAESWL